MLNFIISLLSRSNLACSVLASVEISAATTLSSEMIALAARRKGQETAGQILARQHKFIW